MQLLIKVKHMRWNILIPRKYSLWHASFWLTTQVLFAMRNLVGWLENFNLEDWWMSVQALRKQCSAGLTIFMTLRYAVYGTLLFAPTYRPPQSRWVLEQVLYGQLTRLSSLRESGYARLQCTSPSLSFRFEVARDDSNRSLKNYGFLYNAIFRYMYTCAQNYLAMKCNYYTRLLN